jgi:hypothetical protein
VKGGKIRTLTTGGVMEAANGSVVMTALNQMKTMRTILKDLSANIVVKKRKKRINPSK